MGPGNKQLAGNAGSGGGVFCCSAGAISRVPGSLFLNDCAVLCYIFRTIRSSREGVSACSCAYLLADGYYTTLGMVSVSGLSPLPGKGDFIIGCVVTSLVTFGG